MSKTAYFDRNGRPVQKVEWQRLRCLDDYRIVRQYDNGAVRVTLEWLGEVRDYVNLFKDCYPMFRLNVSNYNTHGELRPDPVENGVTHPTEAGGVEHYEAFLERWTASHRSDDGQFVEEDNSLVPPPPPDPDAPNSDVSDIKLGVADDGVGAW